MGIVWGNPLLLTSLYSLIHADYWKGWKQNQNKYWVKHYKKTYEKKLMSTHDENSTDNFLPAYNYDDIVLSKNAIK
jgi:hypothetical protein